MSATTFTPGPSARLDHPSGGATALAAGHSGRPFGAALRALKVFAAAAFSVAVLGEYAQEAGVKRR
ncbi:hypothetical protein BGM19_17645 [Streptomyces agglomeratus]|uniref:Uncharacterized protein n=1 Tax=Streptomyces agglomeratus TaxID=285458 RepID=A0A1E5P9V9_9ACTN|nr:hypothetical protein [Streptomyces agglomeratus]OEJ26320.1 hypothetical protein AS594_19310 [Streptomyces agglomeratus]OEJ52184.1 hypothetical protein BGK72_16795 [Streptomyces agglomeratus]OEJ59543.1 hypothetical protein BGM19_17645 [Streptomyces agglomeratus]